MKLDLSWFPLAQFLEDKFKWADMIANTKQIRLSIQDNTVSIAAGIQKLLELSSRDTSTLSTDLVVRDIEGGATIVLSLTYQSPHFALIIRRGGYQPLSSCSGKSSQASAGAATLREIISAC